MSNPTQYHVFLQDIRTKQSSSLKWILWSTTYRVCMLQKLTLHLSC